MPTFISKHHLKASAKRLNIVDSEQKGFTLRTTPNGVFSYWYQFLNKKQLDPKTGKPKCEWHKIGEHGELRHDGETRWNPVNARQEATRLAGLVAQGKSLRVEKQKQVEAVRAGGLTFEQLHDEYFAYCQEPMLRRWGTVPRKESWQNMQYSVSRALDRWRRRLANEITPKEIMELYREYVKEGHPSAANCMLGDLRTMFNWGMDPDLGYISVNPCPKLSRDKKAVEVSKVKDGRALDADEIKTFWFGVDDSLCPGDRLSHLALKLTLVTCLRSGEVVQIPMKGVAADTVTIPLRAVKSRHSEKAQPVVQPLNSLAREILDEAMSIGKPDREYVFPKGRKGRKRMQPYMSQQSLSSLMTRQQSDQNGRMGLNEYIGLDITEHGPVTPHTLRRTGACILKELDFSDADIGKVLTHKVAEKDAAPVTQRYLPKNRKLILARQRLDPRVEALDKLDTALREILGLKAVKFKMAA